ncbi:threonine/serine dehydratase [Roseibium denhamense]|uniref:Threonine dehydratase n=1 Tax=Roseibium denhamense TaxID=76305 RepID=A0ABY1NB76_9HYPH|nr:threonine/serine dehydratase [Roseibium denhamense]MTI05636.1 threonine/serine dehydratase [Roseibium denhamense]SMP03430.1 threonine dehydratase [Roseibium denhamense]
MAHETLNETDPKQDAKAVSFDDVVAAAGRIKDEAVLTPLLSFPVLNERTGFSVYIKPESMQRTGSFKFRGAYNRLSQFSPAERDKGVVACSSGNHAQGVAAAAKILGMPATIIMPADAPAIKLARTRAYGAEVITYDREHQDREAIAAEICARTGGTFVHPYNDASVIAGQGTVGLELAHQAKAQGVALDRVLACTGGGGLSSGIALALSQDMPDAVFHTVEPAGFDDYKRSLQAGTLLSNAAKTGSICDALLSESPGEIGFSILRGAAGEGLVVTDEEVLEAVAFAFTELKLVVEPGGVAALAAVLSGKVPGSPEAMGLVLTGGNIDPDMLQIALAR